VVVVDTSVVYKWFSPENEELLPQALSILENHLHNKETLIALDLTIYELANAWATKTKLDFSQIKIFLRDLAETRIKIEPITFELIGKAVDFSKKYNVSVYDASYAVLAMEKECVLFTADSKFVERVGLPFIKHLSEGPSSP